MQKTLLATSLIEAAQHNVIQQRVAVCIWS